MQTFKEIYSNDFLQKIAETVKMIYPPFNISSFHHAVTDNGWSNLVFKQRMRRITTSLHEHLSDDFLQDVQVIEEISRYYSGVGYMFLPDYVELYGLEDFERSMLSLEKITKSSSSEFAIRRFIERDSEKTLATMLTWTSSPDEHLRRLASEGCRPLLPWSFHLKEFIDDPSPIIPILENLIEDDSEYVRKSVANNLNDISKNHPDLVKTITKKWLGKSKYTDRLLKHGCRTLLKTNDGELHALFGFTDLDHVFIQNLASTSQVSIGDVMEFSFDLLNNEAAERKMRIDYEIHFVKANGQLSEKKFRLSEKEYPIGKTKIRKTHSFERITTRTYYQGKHGIAIYINGKLYGSTTFNLINNIRLEANGML